MSEELLAAVVDRLGELSFVLRSAFFKGPHRQPRQVPRPGAMTTAAGNGERRPPARPPPQMSSPAEVKAFFGSAVRYTPTPV